MSAKPLGVIPARMASTRFPGKVLAPIGGKPLLQWVVERVRLAKELGGIVVATDSEEVQNFCRTIGVDCCMTRADHESGSDRVAEVAAALDADLLINVQGDEPLICPDLIDSLARHLAEGDWEMVTAATPIRELSDLENPSVVKVVRAADGGAHYFSREPIPHVRDAASAAETLAQGYHLRHLGIYGYRRAFLERFIASEPAPLELAEKLEQLRALHIGGRIHVSVTEATGPGVDHPEDVAVAEAALRAAGLLD